MAGARISWDEPSAGAEVVVPLTTDGGRRFGDLTARLVGKKIAFLLDGAVTSAPVVQARVGSGQISIIVGDQPEDLKKAESLVAALGTRPLPFQAEVMKIVEVPAKVTPGYLEFARVVVALAVGLVTVLLLLLLARRTRPIDPDVDPIDEEPSRAVAVRKLVVTCFGLVLAALAATVSLPGINQDLFAQLAPSAGPGAPVGLFMLGIGPVLTAYLLVELVALLVPPWRRLRTGGPAERGRLAPAVAVLALVVAVMQAWFLVSWLRTLGLDATHALPGGAMAFYRSVGLLLAGTVALAILALLVDRFGLGNGFVVVLLGGMATSAISIFHWLGDDDTWLDERLGVGAGIALAAILTSGILRWRLRARSAASVFRLPTAGLVPYGFPAAVIGLLSLSMAALPSRFSAAWNELTAPGGALLEVAILIVAGAALSWLFSRPSRLGATARVLDHRALRVLRRGFVKASLVSIAYLCALFAVERLLSVTTGSPTAYFAGRWRPPRSPPPRSWTWWPSGAPSHAATTWSRPGRSTSCSCPARSSPLCGGTRSTCTRAGCTCAACSTSSDRTCRSCSWCRPTAARRLRRSSARSSTRRCRRRRRGCGRRLSRRCSRRSRTEPRQVVLVLAARFELPLLDRLLQHSLDLADAARRRQVEVLHERVADAGRQGGSSASASRSRSTRSWSSLIWRSSDWRRPGRFDVMSARERSRRSIRCSSISRAKRRTALSLH